MRNPTRRDFMTALGLGGLGALFGGCIIEGPVGNGRGTLFVPGEVADGIWQGTVGQIDLGGNHAPVNDFGSMNQNRKSKYSFPFVIINGEYQKRPVISLSESDTVYFGSLYNIWNKDYGEWVSFYDQNDHLLFRTEEITNQKRGERLLYYPVSRNILEKAGSKITFIHHVIDQGDRNKKIIFDKYLGESYWAPITR